MMHVIQSLSNTWRSRLHYLYRNLFSYNEPSISSIDTSYDEYWHHVTEYYQSAEFRLNPRYVIIASHIRKGSSVLDLGMGCGHFLAYLRHSRNVIPFGVDISDAALSVASNYYNLPCQQADIQDPKFQITSMYDYIVITEVLEHLSDPALVLQKVKNKFRKNLIISIPNIAFYIHRLRLLFGRYPMDWVHHPDEHLHHWSISDFKWWLYKINNYLGYHIDAIFYPVGISRLKDIWPSLFASNILLFLSQR